MILKLVNNTTKKQYELTITDPTFGRLYITGNIALENNMDDGEYTYWVVDDNKILATGLAQVGDYVQTDKITYDTQTDDSGYIQYNG